MSDIKFLFRFRDLVASTIEEHERVIKQHNWVWWGWWKRPSEDSRSDVWDDLANSTKSSKVEVGLFDAGSGKVFLAEVIDVIKPPKTDGRATENIVRVPEQEEDHVPSYYRASPFSRAWMKITNIASEPVAFFNEYSFAEAPKLPNYTAATLRRLVDKKIVSAEELRLMDTTIWRVRQAKPTDSSEQILLSVQALSDAVSTEVVRCKGDAILHLTDVHFATGQNRAEHVWRYEQEEETRHTMVEAIAAALAKRESKLKTGLLIISGDFAFIGSAAEFNEARIAIQRLLGILDLSTDHLVIIPGNHDIQWSTDATYDANAKVDPTSQASKDAKKNYEEFYRQIFRHEPNRHLSMGRRFAFPCGMTIDVCGLNSSSLGTGKNFLAGMGRTDEGAFGEVANQLGWNDDKTMGLRLLVIHHHLAVTDDLEPAQGFGKGYGMAVDAVRIQRLAAGSGVHLALHGHKHRVFIWRSSVYELPENTQPKFKLGELSIIGGGSAGSSETTNNSNYFNVIELRPGKLALNIFKSQNRGLFGLMQTWDAELLLCGENGLKLGDWTGPR